MVLPTVTTEDASDTRLLTSHIFDHVTLTTAQNSTLPASSSADVLNAVTYILWCTVSLVLLVFGTFGNVMIVVVMRRMRASQSTACLSVYFTALALSDQCLLTSVLWFWVDAVFTWPPSFYRYDLLCTVLYFVCYTTTQMSAWFLVSMTYQRVTSVVAPHRVGVLCTVRRGKIVVTTIVVVACVLNLHFLFTFEYSRHYGECSPRDNHAVFIYNYVVVDMFLASVIPFLLLVVGNSVLIAQVIQAMKISRKLKGATEKDPSSQRNEVSPMTKTLILTSTVFLILTLPICILDAYRRTVGIDTQIADDYSQAVVMLTNVVTNLLWFSASASNFYLYVLSGKKFREEAKRCLGRPSLA